MNTLVKAIVLSLSTVLVAAPAMAAPQEHNPQQHHQQYGHQPVQNHHKTPVNSDYVLTNVMSHNIIKIIAG